MSGAGAMLKQARPDCKIIVTEPDGAALLSGKEWKPHKIQVRETKSFCRISRL